MRPTCRFAALWLGAASTLLLTLAWACGGVVSAPDPPACDSTLWAHVYDPARLQVIDECRSMTGVVHSEHHNDDGDVDMQIVPDPPDASLVNAVNTAKLQGALQVEAICQVPVQADRAAAAPACGAFRGTVAIPPVGAHVQVVGSYVLDTIHGWMEIHPVTRITVLSP